MYRPATFRPTKNDNAVLHRIAGDYPIHAGSIIELIRMALDTYSKHKNLTDRVESLEQRVESLEAQN